jgi:hypothetical protein
MELRRPRVSQSRPGRFASKSRRTSASNALGSISKLHAPWGPPRELVGGGEKCHNRLGEIHDRSYENQRHRATSLNLGLRVERTSAQRTLQGTRPASWSALRSRHRCSVPTLADESLGHLAPLLSVLKSPFRVFTSVRPGKPRKARTPSRAPQGRSTESRAHLVDRTKRLLLQKRESGTKRGLARLSCVLACGRREIRFHSRVPTTERPHMRLSLMDQGLVFAVSAVSRHAGSM